VQINLARLWTSKPIHTQRHKDTDVSMNWTTAGTALTHVVFGWVYKCTTTACYSTDKSSTLLSLCQIALALAISKFVALLLLAWLTAKSENTSYAQTRMGNPSRHKPSCGPPAMSPTQTQRSVLFTHTAWRQKDKTAYSCDNSDKMLVALVHPHYTVLRCH